VIDTGVSLSHEDLNTQIYINPNESSNGRDDDSNGVIDDVIGYNFVTMQSSSEDDHGHGSHCAGIIAANRDNNRGVIGIAPDAKILAIKVLDAEGSGDSMAVYQGVVYAIENGADVLSISFGGEGFSYLEYLAFLQVSRADIPVAVASGNDGLNIDLSVNKSYPASFEFDNIVSVGASDVSDSMASWSNYGKMQVDIVAPGENILSTVLNNSYEMYSGTSMATPYVAGVMALLKSQDSSLSATKIKTILLENGDTLNALSSVTASGTRLNAKKALLAIVSEIVPKEEPVLEENEAPIVDEEVVEDSEEESVDEDEKFDEEEAFEDIDDENEEAQLSGILEETYPNDTEMSVEIDTVIELLFGEELNVHQIKDLRIAVEDEMGNRIRGYKRYEGDVLTFIPARVLEEQTQYSVNVEMEIEDLAYTFSFVTEGENEEEFTDEDSGLSKKVMVFGIPVYATATISDTKLLHAAKVMAEYLDNDSDGAADDVKIVTAMKSQNAYFFMSSSEAEEETLNLPDGIGQILYGFESIPSGSSANGFDATIEEVLHLITQTGYAVAYPSAFGEDPGSRLTNAMDIARGGQFMSVPSRYPSSAWYSYDDTTCSYQCMAAEYFYWALTSKLGAQEYSGRFAEISHEWLANTVDKLARMDEAMSTLLGDKNYAIPTTLPKGNYEATTLSVEAL
jgi:hypothetical protein